MPLPEPKARRESLHRRTIEIVGYRRADGLYDIELRGGGDRYEARAIARADTQVASDTGCTVLSLQVRDGLADFAPSTRCWNR